MAAIAPATSPLLANKDALAPDAGQRQLTSLTPKTPVSSTATNTSAVVHSLAEKRQEALQLVNQTLSRAYELLSSRGTSAIAQYQAFEPLTAEKVAGNILGFIERRLQLDAAEGATPEQLASRLEAGLSGFKKGFAEAQQKLEALSMLSPEVKTDIGNTYDLVLQGIDGLRQRFVGGLASTTPAVSGSAVPDVNQALAGVASAQWGSASARRFDFELNTREGDRVKISLAQSQSQQFQYANTGQQQSLGAYASQGAQFSLVVEGDLNSDELAAINDLLSQVNSLASQFYAGNLDAAWEQALALGFDEQQIGSYRLSLSQVEVQTVSLRESSSGVESPVWQARDLIEQLQRQWQTAAIFPDPLTLLQTLAQAVDSFYGDNQGYRFSLFMRERLEVMQPHTGQAARELAGDDSTIA